jgi:hypothetical protein
MWEKGAVAYSKILSLHSLGGTGKNNGMSKSVQSLYRPRFKLGLPE